MKRLEWLKLEFSLPLLLWIKVTDVQLRSPGDLKHDRQTSSFNGDRSLPSILGFLNSSGDNWLRDMIMKGDTPSHSALEQTVAFKLIPLSGNYLATRNLLCSSGKCTQSECKVPKQLIGILHSCYSCHTERQLGQNLWRRHTLGKVQTSCRHV